MPSLRKEEGLEDEPVEESLVRSHPGVWWVTDTALQRRQGHWRAESPSLRLRVIPAAAALAGLHAPQGSSSTTVTLPYRCPSSENPHRSADVSITAYLAADFFLCKCTCRLFWSIYSPVRNFVYLNMFECLVNPRFSFWTCIVDVLCLAQGELDWGTCLARTPARPSGHISF